MKSPARSRAPESPRAEVYRGNGIGVVLAGIATLVLVAALFTPWWNCSVDYQGDHITLTLYPGTTYFETCSGSNCGTPQESYTYSSRGLAETGAALEGTQTALGVDLFVGVTAFLAAVITWADRARLGAVRTTIAAAVAACILSLGTPIWLSNFLPGALGADLSPLGVPVTGGPLAGWVLPFVAFALFAAAAVAEWTTLRYAKPWDAPLSTATPTPSGEEPPVTAPPDRVLRLERLRNAGTITDEDLETQKARILSLEPLVQPVPIPPNSGSRKAAQAHLEFLRRSGRYKPDQLEAQRANVLRAYGLSPDLLFPEEEVQALVVLQRSGGIDQGQFERRKKEILDRI
ncbi:MAG TPA: SHOCT domain-containing protein [Thermoplasmata archaeon]|nr:SHOCT domain-containing protein [Thermoplasmata archaeon]